MSISIATAPASRDWPPDEAADDFVRYVRTLVRLFARHRPGENAGWCRCGRLRPCIEEERVAFLLELAGEASR